MQLIVYGNVEFWLYFHDDGEQYYLHHDYWPKVPPMKHVRKIESMVDIVIRKELTVSGQACGTNNYSYFGKYDLKVTITMFYLTPHRVTLKHSTFRTYGCSVISWIQ